MITNIDYKKVMNLLDDSIESFYKSMSEKNVFSKIRMELVSNTIRKLFEYRLKKELKKDVLNIIKY